MPSPTKKEAWAKRQAVNLGIGLAAEGKKILLLDADAQGNLTDPLGFHEPDSLSVSLATMLVKAMTEEPFEPKEGILHHYEGIDLMPGNIELSAVEVALVNTMSRAAQRAHYPSGQPEQRGSHLPLCHGEHVRRLSLSNAGEQTALFLADHDQQIAGSVC